MSNQDLQDIPLSFPQEEEIISVFDLNDLLRERHQRILASPFSWRSYPHGSYLSPYLGQSAYPVIGSMTPLERSNFSIFKDVLKEQFCTDKGFLSNGPANLAQGVTIAELMREMGLTGQAYQKTVGGRNYVILKGYPGERILLKGTRYLDTHPEIVRLGLAEMSVKAAFKKGFKTSIWVYGTVKAYEAVKMIVEDGSLKPSYFSEMVTDIPKLAITSLVTAAAAGAIAVVGVPVATGAAIVLAVSIGTGIALEFLDKKVGFTEKLNQAADQMWKNLKEKWNSTFSSNQDPFSTSGDPLNGLIFGGRGLGLPRILREGGHSVYIA